METGLRRLVVVSNRLPAALKQQDGVWKVQQGSGGLVTAMAPVLKNRGGVWIGWSGAANPDVDVEGLLADFSDEAGYDLCTVSLTEEEVEGYYYGFSNEIIWPLFHDLQSRCRFHPRYWRSYLDVNFKFAEVVARTTTDEDYIWVQDYHLMHQAFFLKSMGVKRNIGFFLHIPFPPPDIFMKLPWRAKLIQALTEFDLVGFQTAQDRRNFVGCLQRLMPGAKVEGRGAVVTVNMGSRSFRLGAFPISIDYNQFSEMAKRPEVARQTFDLKEALHHRKIILGVDRLDYTKGIPERIRSIQTLLRSYPDLQGHVVFIQIAVPSREEVDEYKELRTEIEQLVGRVNGEFSYPGWVPVQYLYRSLPHDKLVAYYAAADIGLVTPLRDGMNLVAKEYCACNNSESGALVLSEFAGAAAQLQRHAYLVNPYDMEGVAKALHRALHWEKDERRSHMSKLRDQVRKNNIFWWVDSFLQAGIAKSLGDFPEIETVQFDQI
ncbi:MULTISPECIES: trehalose-6-phosphate synthase [unclassified Pseudodesulfovibrio]|uniref:alpha,alpha-trehalose-phosphate synthase (UDP-forming) n=1 Tax=unclassified Pseudodesulfovibrio TaxID=2661612 RepID=UPI000FEC15C7|nr:MULTISPECIES: trehalose-6-phosphate synthase [unclassified Pseudodesulfovibrio]MCJ2164346.1 trehalose-6-phosphate synthase [Pseudodesulfovibrio sp. S3-i]RWU04556.1 trehalose-6-phosphate synthase [Pseudodesulfovibrio sp. S3]